MNKCIVIRMIKIFANGLLEMVVLCGMLALVFGLPALLIWWGIRMITVAWGERIAYGIVGIALLVFIVACLTMAMIDLYNRAKKECQ